MSQLSRPSEVLSDGVADASITVCLVTGEYPPAVGGVADYTQCLALELGKAGARVSVVSGPLPDGTQDEPADDGPAIRRVSGWGHRQMDEVARAVADHRPDVIHLQYQAAAFGMAPTINVLPFLLRRCGVRAPVITTFHDLRVPYLFPKAGRLRSLAVHSLVGASSGVIFTDSADLVRAHPRRSAAWIPMGPTIAPATGANRMQARERLGIGPEDAVIAHFGFLNSSKGIETLLGAIERVCRAGIDVRLLFVGDTTGTSDPTNAAVASRIREVSAAFGLEERITYTGRCTPAELSAAFAASDIAALPYTDGASLRRSSLLACLAHGLPVVTTEPVQSPKPARGSAVEPFGDPDAYRLDSSVVSLAPRKDEAGLAREIYRLLEDPARMAELATRGKALAERLSWKAVAHATMSFYARVLEETTS